MQNCPYIIVAGFVLSCLSARPAEIVEVIPVPRPEFPVSGVVKSADHSYAIEVAPGDDGHSNLFRFRGPGGLTRGWEIPTWMLVRSVIFIEDTVWFMAWCQKGGASWPVCVARCSLHEADKNSLAFFDLDANGVTVRRLVSQDGDKIIAFGGVNADRALEYKKYGRKWLRIRVGRNEFREISWKKVIEIRNCRLGSIANGEPRIRAIRKKGSDENPHKVSVP